MPRQTKPTVIRAVQPSATLEIDGETYHLVFSYNAIAEAETVSGGNCNLLHGLTAPATINALQLRGIVFAALRSRHPQMTLAQAGDLIRVDTIPAVLEAIGESWKLSMPEKKRDPLEAAEPRDGD